MGSQGGEDVHQGGSYRTGWVRQQLVDWAVPCLHADKLGGTTGEQDRWHNPWFQDGKIKPQILWLQKPVGIMVAGETPSLIEEFLGETYRVLECTQNHPPRESALERPNLLMGSSRSD